MAYQVLLGQISTDLLARDVIARAHHFTLLVRHAECRCARMRLDLDFGFYTVMLGCRIVICSKSGRAQFQAAAEIRLLDDGCSTLARREEAGSN